MNLPSYIYPVKRLVVSDHVGRWCQLPYPNHPKGCPNFWEAKEECPPKAPSVDEYFDLSRALYFVHSEFDLNAHADMMKQRHPHWSDRQCRCVLYWQSRSRKQLKQRTSKAASLLGTDAMTMIPEAMGVNVYVTARLAGLRLEPIRSLSLCRHVALLGWRKNSGQLSLFRHNHT